MPPHHLARLRARLTSLARPCDASPTSGAVSSDRLMRLRQALDNLPEPARSIYLAHCRDDQAYPAIALAMGMTMAEVQHELALALSLLSEALDAE